MKTVEETLALLGLPVQDKVTGFDGVITSVSFDLYGCIQVVIMPKYKGKDTPDGRWFDVERLDIQSPTPVMSPPDFLGDPKEKGGEQLPLKE